MLDHAPIDGFRAPPGAVEWRLALTEEAPLRFEPVIALGLLIGACDRGPPPPPMTPVGAPGFATVDGQTLPRFDARRPPVVRIEGAAGPEWALWLEPTKGDALRLQTTVEAQGEATFLRATVSDRAPSGRMMLSVRAGDDPLRAWSIWLGAEPVPVRYAAVEPELADLDARPPETADERRWWHFARGKALWRLGRLDDAIAAMQASADAALDPALNAVGEGARALRMAANLANRRGRLSDAEALVDRAEALSARIDDRAGRSTARYFRAQVLQFRGELRDAETQIRAAIADALAVGRHDLADYARVMQAVNRQLQGHHRAARAQLEGLSGRLDGMGADLAGVVWGNLGWVLLEGIERGIFTAPADIDAARRAFEEALAINRGRAAIAANHHANLAALALRAGDLAAVARHIEAHDALDPERAQQGGLFVSLVEARRMLALGEHDRAEVAFSAVERRARAEVGGVTGEYVWRARLGRARARRARGDADGALAAFEEALAARETAATRTGLQESRAVFFADHRALYDEAITAALGAGRVEEAFGVADRARARLVVDLEVQARIGRLDATRRAEWQRRLEAYLTRRQAFEADRDAGLMLTPAERPAWQAKRAAERRALQEAFDGAYAWLDRAAPITARGATAADVRRGLAADEALWLGHHMASGAAVLFRVRPEGIALLDRPQPLDGVAHRYLVGPVAPLDWLEHGSVSRLNHAGQLIGDRPPAAGPPTVIGDPDGTLPHARREALAVAAGWPEARVLIGAAADRATVRAALSEARRVHFAGHGVLAASRPWDAHLRLTSGQQLTLEDLLLARPTAALVLLSGCETGAEAALGGGIRLGLAQGFLAAGSRSVVAADRVVPDADAARFVERFYAAGGAESPAEALRVAALAAKADGSPVWDAWHVWGRR